MKIAAFIDGYVGLKVAKIFKENSRVVDILVLNHNAPSEYKEQIIENIDFKEIYEYSEFIQLTKNYKSDEKLFDLGILCWWPYIIKSPLLELSQNGFLNFHPSFLPYGRGKHPNFWTFIDDTPFGVTLHWANESIDGGDVAFQKEIEKEWVDNGETLYLKALDAIVTLFDKHFSEIISGKIPRSTQTLPLKIHYAKELESASYIDLEKLYKAKDFINLLRARTFKDFPSCWFEEEGKRYEVRIDIKEVHNEYNKR